MPGWHQNRQGCDDMVGMPYHLEKGPWLTVLEDYLNAEDGRSLDFLRQLRATRTQGRISDLDFIASPALNQAGEGRDDVQERARRAHLEIDWFGGADSRLGFVEATLRRLPAEVVTLLTDRGQVPDQAPTTAAALSDFGAAVIAAVQDVPGARLDRWPSTGFWFQYHGDVHGILRETLIRAIEVSLGLDNDEEPSGPPERRMPIELFWKCPQRWVEGWVTWRWERANSIGQVTVLLATPGVGKPILDNPTKGRDARLPTGSTLPGGEEAPGAHLVGPGPTPGQVEQYPKGMWVVSHTEHAQLPATPQSGPSGAGQWGPPTFGPSCVGVGDLVVVQPAESEGGVDPFGRAFVAPPAYPHDTEQKAS